MGIPKEIKKIMGTENLSYRDTLDFKKNNYYSSAFKYSDITNRKPPVSVISSNNAPLNNDFPNLNINHHAHYSTKRKPKFHSPSSFKKHFTLPQDSFFSLSNRNCLNHTHDNHQISEHNTNDFTWVHTLSHKLSESLLNSPALLTSFSSSDLQTFIESSLHTLLAIPNFDPSS